MHNTVKQICLCLTIMSWALLLRTVPDFIITWIEEHWCLVAIFSTVTWLWYCVYDNHKN